MREHLNKLRDAFSLMEMMIVLLIVAIIAAASAPMVSRKMMRDAAGSDSPWVFTGLGNSIAYNLSGNNRMTAMIGTSRYNANGSGVDHPRLVLAAGNDAATPALVFADNTGTFATQITAGNNRVTINGAAEGGSAAVGEGSVAIGMGQNLTATPGNVTALGNGVVAATRATAVGSGAGAQATDSVALGALAQATAASAIAIGGSGDNSEDGANLTNASSANAIAIGRIAQATGDSTIAIGNQAKASPAENNNNATTNALAIGVQAQAQQQNSVAIGSVAQATNQNSIAIGNSAQAQGSGSIAIGRINTNNPRAAGADSIAIGTAAQTGMLNPTNTNRQGTNSIAIGNGAQATWNNSIAIGNGVTTGAEDQIVIGNSTNTVYIPGNLVVGNNTLLGFNQCGDQSGSKTFIYAKTNGLGNYAIRSALEIHRGSNDDAVFSGPTYKSTDYNKNGYFPSWVTSDRRLKNVGKPFEGGLAELKKLDLYHYTFKKDEAKTPHVGVMAQDLQKVFPSAVTKGEDGYLMIRMEDMFYAVVNAVKELDAKIAAVVEDVKSAIAKNNEQDKLIAEQQNAITAQQKTIEEQQALIENLEKRIEKLEKSAK